MLCGYRMFIEAIPVAVLGILFAIHILLFSWKYVERGCNPDVVALSGSPPA
jgi:hypothetical protein